MIAPNVALLIDRAVIAELLYESLLKAASIEDRILALIVFQIQMKQSLARGIDGKTDT